LSQLFWRDWIVKMSGTMSLRNEGMYTFYVESAGRFKMIVDGQVVFGVKGNHDATNHKFFENADSKTTRVTVKHWMRKGDMSITLIYYQSESDRGDKGSGFVIDMTGPRMVRTRLNSNFVTHVASDYIGGAGGLANMGAGKPTVQANVRSEQIGRISSLLVDKKDDTCSSVMPKSYFTPVKVAWRDVKKNHTIYRTIPEDRYRAIWWRADLRPGNEPVARIHHVTLVGSDKDLTNLEVRVGEVDNDWSISQLCNDGKKFTLKAGATVTVKCKTNVHDYLNGRFIYVVAHANDGPPPVHRDLHPAEKDLLAQRGEYANYTAYFADDLKKKYVTKIEPPVLNLCEVKIMGVYEQLAVRPLKCNDYCSPNLVGF
jgi:hypothetical protein